METPDLITIMIFITASAISMICGVCLLILGKSKESVESGVGLLLLGITPGAGAVLVALFALGTAYLFIDALPRLIMKLKRIE